MSTSVMADPQQRRLITTVVRFRPCQGSTRWAARDLFEGATPTCRQIPGLIRKYYLCGDGPVGGRPVGGGLYLWEDRQAAERFYTAEWRQALTQRFGVQPEVLFIERSVPVA